MADVLKSLDDICAMNKRYRTNFVNALSGVKSANLIGTTGLHGDNLAIINSVFHLGADPALMGMIMRPHTVQRDTLSNIKENGCYTINHVCRDIVEQAHQTSARYPETVSEFDAVGLTPYFSDSFTSPYVKECRLKIGLMVEDIVFISANQTEMVIGSIQEVIVDSACLQEDGHLDLNAIDSIGVAGLDHYQGLQSLARYQYAKPDVKLEQHRGGSVKPD